MWINNWKIFFSQKKNLYLFVFSLFFLVVTLNLFTRFLVFNETLPYSAPLTDPILKNFNAVDLDTFAFIFIYIPIILFIIYVSFRPRMLIFTLTSYTFLVWMRFLTIYLTPLEVPAGAIDFNDPLVFLLGTGEPVMKDLFFSGHTSTLTLITLISSNIRTLSPDTVKLKPDNYFKYFLAVCLCIVALCVILQKAHYTVDVVAAPFFAFGVYAITKKIYGIK